MMEENYVDYKKEIHDLMAEFINNEGLGRQSEIDSVMTKKIEVLKGITDEVLENFNNIPQLPKKLPSGSVGIDDILNDVLDVQRMTNEISTDLKSIRLKDSKSKFS